MDMKDISVRFFSKGYIIKGKENIKSEDIKCKNVKDSGDKFESATDIKDPSRMPPLVTTTSTTPVVLSAAAPTQMELDGGLRTAIREIRPDLQMNENGEFLNRNGDSIGGPSEEGPVRDIVNEARLRMAIREIRPDLRIRPDSGFLVHGDGEFLNQDGQSIDSGIAAQIIKQARHGMGLM